MLCANKIPDGEEFFHLNKSFYGSEALRRT